MSLFPNIKRIILIVITILGSLLSCVHKDDRSQYLPEKLVLKDSIQESIREIVVNIKNDVTVGGYFQYIDSIVTKYDTLTPYKLSEHLLVRANPWIIDTLQNTDYYRMMERDSFVYDQKKMIVLPKDAFIVIPDSIKAEKLLKSFQETLIDINIPEFKLRLFEDSKLLYEFPVRVGRNEKKYLSMARRVLDLRTKIGSGTIVSYVRNPDYYNPADGHRYYATHRDDKKLTALPQIPFLVPEINGIRFGQLIHPTTNPKTLGKAYSNGCIGTKEADAWMIYYYAPIGTKVRIRYDLKIKDVHGKDSILKNIYGYNKKS